MIFWKEAWLEPAPPDAKPEPALDWSRLLPSESVAEIDDRELVVPIDELLGATEPFRVADSGHTLVICGPARLVQSMWPRW